MKNLFYFLMVMTTFSILTGCATIIGGSKYYANVQVPDHPNAKIEYNGTYRGTGSAYYKAKRSQSNNFSVTIKEDGCKTQTKDFTKRSFRGWAFVGTVASWTGFVLEPFIPLPFGVAVDLATGALWKPNINEKGVTKEDFNHYIYNIDYTGCKDKIK